MWPIKVEYDLSMGMYRQAMYYSLVYRYRLAFLISVPAIIMALFFLLLHLMGVLTFTISFFIGGACFIWLLLVAARVERNIRLYMRSPDCLLGKHFKVQFNPNQFKLIIEQKKIYNTIPYQQLAAVFELSSLYMLYLDGQETYLISKKDMNQEDVQLLRNRFHTVLGERFISRFIQKSR